MKKVLLALACALFLGQSYVSAQETVYVEDPNQGILLNKFKNNWFITAEGGASMLITDFDKSDKIADRIQPAASIYVGKWFSPIIGLRAGVNWTKQKGLSDGFGIGVNPEAGVDGYYTQKYMQIGPAFDAMLNLTNWWCGYKPNRVYNFSVYGGVGMYWTLARTYENGEQTAYENQKDCVLAARGGIINSFNLSKQVQLALDLRVVASDRIKDQANPAMHKIAYDAQAYLSLTYLFNERTWSAPVVPVCPEPENCDAYRAALAAAEARVADLESQLAACLARPTEVVEVVEDKGPMATIYFPCNVSRLSTADVRVVKAIAEVMKANPDTKYVVTGWADNYTGTPAINDNLRKNRAANVEKQLLRSGVAQSQVSTETNDANLNDIGEKYVALGRAATINVVK